MQRVATFDIETDGLLDECTRVWCGCIKDHSDGSVRSYGPECIPGLLRDLMEYDVLIGHNCIAFDFPVLRKLHGWEYEGKKVDTVIMSRTQRPNRRAPAGCSAGPHSVEAWGRRLGDYKLEHEVWTQFSEAMLRRCQQDVEVQYKIFHTLLEEGAGEGWKEAHKLNFKLFELLQRQEEYGWTVDKAALDRHMSTLVRWIDRIDRSVGPHLPLIVEKGNEFKKPFKKDGSLTAHVVRYLDDVYGGSDGDCDYRRYITGPFSRVGFRPVDLNSNAEAKQFLLDQGWRPKEWNTNDAGERTSAKLSHDDPFVGFKGGLGKLIARRVQCQHRLSNLRGWEEHIRDDGRIPTPVGGFASTGRIRHKVVVNVPSPGSGAFFARQMREVFTAKPGWVMVGVDSKGNQIRQLAARLGDSGFTEAVLKDKERDGTDFHEYNRGLCGGITRTRAKNFFYGFIFGARAPTISKQIGSSVEEAQRLIDLYLEQIPTLRILIDTLTEQWKATAQKWYDTKFNRWVYKNGYIKGLDGRPIMVPNEHSVLCYALQSDEAIQLATAYVMYHEDLEEAGYRYKEDWGTVIWMHDEFQLECRPEIAEDVARIVSDSIKKAGEKLNISCPHEGDWKVGRSWAETH